MQKAIDNTDLVLNLYEIGSIQFGNFTMASGLASPIYIDLRRIIARPLLLKQVAQVYQQQLGPLEFDHLAAVPYGALAIGTAVSLEMNRPLIFPRKEAKTHGTGRVIEGLFNPGDKAVIIEDLVTKGGSALKAISVLQEAGLTIVDVVVLLDREQGGSEALANQGYRLHAAMGLLELLAILEREQRISETEVKAVRQYLDTL
jgi:uridine monophosphate synthetase